MEDGALVLSWEDGRREVLAAPGEVVSATWVPDVVGRPQAVVRETLELALADGRSLAVPLDDWLGADDRAVPFEPSGAAVRPLDASGSTALRISGAAAVAEALALDVHSADGLSPGAREIKAGGEVAIAGRLLLRAWIVPALVAMALAITGLGSFVALLWATGVLGAALLVSLVTSLALDVAADRGRDRLDLPAAPWCPAPVSPTSRAHVRTAVVSPGADWLVVRDEHGRECWTAGPDLGGVRTARVRGSWLAFEDERGTALQRLWWPSWGDADQLASRLEQLADRGYDVAEDEAEPTGPSWRRPPRPGDHLPRDRDGGSATPFPAASIAPIVLLFLLRDLRKEVHWVVVLPATAAVVLALVVMVRGLRRAGDLRTRAVTQLQRHVHDVAP